jgi:hypothetical protein
MAKSQHCAPGITDGRWLKTSIIIEIFRSSGHDWLILEKVNGDRVVFPDRNARLS